MGDTLAGSDLPKVPNSDKREAARRFVNTYPTTNYKDQKFQEGIIEEFLAECAWEHLDKKKFTLDQQIDIGVRQNFLNRPIVIVEGFNFKTPFLTKTWGNFIVNVPYKWLLDFYLYKRIITECYKELSRLPTRGNAGMPIPASKAMVNFGKVIARIKPYIIRRDLFRSHPRTNYINWTESLRQRGNFQDSIYTTLQDLKKRQIFDSQELDHWWFDHLRKKTDYTTLLTNLSSLEILLKVGLM